MAEQALEGTALALEDLDDLEAELVEVCRRQASNSGLKPLKSTVRSRAGLVFSIGIVASSASTFWLPTSWDRATYR